MNNFPINCNGHTSQRRKRTTISKEIKDIFLTLLDQNKTAKEISVILNLSISTVQKLVTRHLNSDLENFKTANEKKTGKKVMHIEESNIIKQLLSTSQITSQNELKLSLAENGYNMSQSSISRLLKSLKITRKRLTLVPCERNSMRVLDGRQAFCQEMGSLSDGMLIYLDETGINGHTSAKYGYSLEGEKAYKMVNANRGQNLSIMCAINNERIVAYDLVDGGYNEERFIEFINNKLLPAIPRGSIVIMDNARFHKTIRVASIFRNSGCRLMFLPPYSPQLNPTEQFFSCFKATYILKTNNLITTRDQRKVIINEILRDTPFVMNGYFIHMRIWVEKGCSRQFFI